MGGIIIALTLVLLHLSPSAPSFAADRVDFFDSKGRRTGYAIIDREAGRVNFYDVHSRRTGWGRIDSTGRIERFDLKGKRQGETVVPFLEKSPKP